MSPRLWSLSAMYQFEAGLFVEIARVSGYHSGFAAANPGVDTQPMPKHTFNYGETSPESLVEFYKNIEEDCEKLGLPASATSARRIKELFKTPGVQYKLMREKYEEFQGRLRDELNGTFCLAIEGRHVGHYNTPHRFGAEVSKRFPNTSDDIEEAGK